MERIRSPLLITLYALVGKWLAAILFSYFLLSNSLAADLPSGWQQQYDSAKHAQVFRPQDPNADILIKYYPKESMDTSDISDWLGIRVSSRKAPNGEWQGDAEVVRDTANYAHALRRFKRHDGELRELHAVAVTADRDQVRLAIMIKAQNDPNKNLIKQGFQILTNIYNVEKNAAVNEGRKKELETNPPKIKGMKLGGRIKAGRYVGSKTWDDEVRSLYEVVLYESGEYEFTGGYDESGHFVYSQANGRLNLVDDFYNSSYRADENFCVYGFNQSLELPMIYARDGNHRYRLRWAGPVDRLSPRQRKQLKSLKRADDPGYQYVTEPGQGVSNDQIETILYTYEDVYNYGGYKTEEAIYLLMKGGRVRDGLPVAPARLDVAKSRSREPGRWGWWKKDDDGYRFSWNIEQKHFKAPSGRQIRSLPIPAGTRLSGDWGSSSSFVSLDFSDVSFWGVYLDDNGRFKRYRRNTKQAGGSMGVGPLVTAHSADEFSAVNIIGNTVGGGSSTRRPPNKNRIGSYEFDGYTLVLKYDSGVVKYLPTFALNERFSGIWFEGGYLSKK
ncbi:MAG: hypothetical protein JAZ11_11090 [Candidatus Thiodiazotropha lotti]|nr:hypothetical protein [Candidatus Thiodiazotropha lotti]